MSSETEREKDKGPTGDEDGKPDFTEQPFTSPDGLRALIRSCIPSYVKSDTKEDDDEVYRKTEPEPQQPSITPEHTVTSNIHRTTAETKTNPTVSPLPVYTTTAHAQIEPHVMDPNIMDPDVMDPDAPEFVYQFTHKSPGLAILIGNSDFDTRESTRKAAPQDIRNMYELFLKLGFKIEYLWNQTTLELQTKLTEYAGSNLVKDIDCLVCVISTHGSEQMVGKGERGDIIPSNITLYEHFLSMKDGPIKTRDVLQIFDDDNCPTLQGKPRLCFIQACRSRLRPGQDLIESGALDSGVGVKIAAPNMVNPRVSYRPGNTLFSGTDAKGAMQSQEGDSQVDTQGAMQSQEGDSQVNTQGTVQSQEGDSQADTWGAYQTPESFPPFPLYLAEEQREIIAPVCPNNFLVMFASVSEKVGWSYDDKGGWLLLGLYDILMKKVRHKERFCLMAALTEVSRKVAQHEESFTLDPRTSQMKSVPGLEHKLTKDVIFDLTDKTTN